MYFNEIYPTKKIESHGFRHSILKLIDKIVSEIIHRLFVVLAKKFDYFFRLVTVYIDLQIILFTILAKTFVELGPNF